MNDHIQIVAQLSKVNTRNKENQQMEKMYNGREEMMNILRCVDLKKLCNVIKDFIQLNKKNVKEGIHFSLFSSSRAIKLRKNIHGLE